MSYEVLARKWRPQVFQDVIGQEHITKTLTNAIKTGRLAHAYLFGGSRGVGKTSVARILAKAINCGEGEPGIPCNRCISCVEITDGSSVDVQEIDGASNRGIDEIRELRENVKYMPSSSRYRVYIIDEIHMLTLQAFNALLKTLEEPPAHVKFIFATTESHKVPVTILSRCQRFDFKRISLAQIVTHLERISKEEEIEINKTGLALIAREAEGSMRDAESLLDQVFSFSGPKVENKHITEILGIIDRDIIFEASRAIIENSPKKCLEIVDQIYNYGYDIKEFYLSLMRQFRNLLISLVAPQNLLLDMNENDREETRRQAEWAGLEKLQVILNLLISREEHLRFTSYPRLILEAAMIKLCHLGDFLSFDDILRKIESLEKRLTTTSTTNEQLKANHLSDPAVQRIPEHPREVEAKQSGRERRSQNWDDFLIFLSHKNNAMSNILKDWRLLKLNEESLEIAKGNQAFSSVYFDDDTRKDQLSGYCRDFFNRDIKVEIVVNDQLALQTSHMASEEHPEPKVVKYANLTAPVQDILNIFQGQVREEFPQPKGGPT